MILIGALGIRRAERAIFQPPPHHAPHARGEEGDKGDKACGSRRTAKRGARSTTARDPLSPSDSARDSKATRSSADNPGMGSTTARSPSAPRMARRKFDHAKAEAYWRNDGGQRRTFAAVAAEFGVSTVAVLRVAEREDWHGTAARLDELARRESERRAVKTIAQRIDEDLRLIDAGKVAVARRLQAGQIDADLSDLVALIKVEQLLVGGPSERLGVETAGHRRSLAEIEAELAALEPAQVDALVVADEVVRQRVAELPAAGVAGDSAHDPLPSQPEADAAAIHEPVGAPVAAAEGVDAGTLEGEVVAPQTAAERFADSERATAAPEFERWRDGRGPLEQATRGR